MLAIAGAHAGPGAADAAIRIWNAPGGGFLLDPANWQGGVAPGAGDEALFDLDAGYGVGIAMDRTIDRISVGRDLVSLNLGGNTLTLARAIGLADPSIALGLTAGDEPALTIGGGTLVGQYASLGFVDGSLASLEITGTTSNLTLNETIAVGDQGVGVFTVLNGATVLNGPSRIGLSATGDGTAVVSGTDAVWTSVFSMRVGFDGVGTVTATNGGLAEASAIELGYNSGGIGDATVSGVTSTLRAAGVMTVGRNGQGSLLVSGGGEALAGSASIGANGGSIGDAIVRDLGSVWTVTNGIEIGQNGIGALTVEQNGLVSASSVGIASGAGSGQVTLNSGGKLSANFQVTAGLTGGFGTITLNGGVLQASGVTIGPGAQLIGQGNVTGDVFNAGILRVGNPIGVLGITGDFDQSAALGGATIVEVGAASDALVVNGAAILGGRLTVSLASGFTPTPGQEFTVLAATTRTGEFQTLQLPAETGGLTYDIEYRGASVVLVVGGSPLIGDLNGDGAVDGADLGLFLGDWGELGGPSDLDGDGVVGGSDLVLLLGNWTG
jgi:T5SS/PEP-CTERM-associated repeat protein